MRFFSMLSLAFVPLALAQGAAQRPSPLSNSAATGPASPAGTNATTSTQPDVPLCPATCLAMGLFHSYCAMVPPPDNTRCMCENSELQAQVAACVVANCTVKDAIRFQGISNTMCGVPGRDQASEYYIITIVFAVIAWLLVGLRLGFKYFAMGPDELGWDDLFILLTAVITIPSAVITCNGTLPNGLGKDIWLVPVNQIYTFLEYFFFMTIFYFLQVGMLKMSLLFFYLRIFPAKPVQRLLWGTVFVNALQTAIYLIIDCVQCAPLSLFWTKWDGEQKGKCSMDINDIVVSNAVVSIALDLWMLAVPTWQLRSLQLHWKKKLGVAAMFAVGTLFTVLSCIRLEVLIRMGHNPKNPTYDELSISIWSTIEITVGIICACMPTFRMLLVRLFPRLAAVTTRSGRYYGSGGRYASGNSKGSRIRAESGAKNLGSGGVRSKTPVSVLTSGGTTDAENGNIPLKELKGGGSATSSAVRDASPTVSIPSGTIRMQTEYSVTSTQFGGSSGGPRLSRNRDASAMVRDEYDDQSRLVIQGNVSPEFGHPAPR